MNTRAIETAFSRIGARLEFCAIPAELRRVRRLPPGLRLSRELRNQLQRARLAFSLEATDVDTGTFQLSYPAEAALQCAVRDVQPAAAALILQVSMEPCARSFLCANDCGRWAVRELDSGQAVQQASQALLPRAVRDALVTLPRRTRADAYRRQGPLFFLPQPDAFVDPRFVLCDEPLHAGERVAHVVEDLTEVGGAAMHVCHDPALRLSTASYKRLLRRRPELALRTWLCERVSSMLMVRGRIVHPDYPTIKLRCWHAVCTTDDTSYTCYFRRGRALGRNTAGLLVAH
jgi:hypothetical protein